LSFLYFESIASFSKQEIMSSFLPEGGCYELLTIIGKGFEDLMIVNLARYKPTGEYVTVRRINLEACSNEMVTFLQGELHVSKLFNHPNIVPYRATFIADNELWVVTSFMAYGSAKDLIGTHFVDGMNELAIAYILQGALKALDYIHHMGYVHRYVLFFFFFFPFYYSHVHTRLGSFLPPAPTPSLTTHSTPSPTPSIPAETILPLSLILL
uniref:STE20-related kinase adapter protein alpha n=1 Tax=Castor canadensis TaxID=51338 RepID=A0A8C0ZQF7_CASCN